MMCNSLTLILEPRILDQNRHRIGVLSPLIILGIDPGLRRTGWSIIRAEANRLDYIACGVIMPKSNKLQKTADRLSELFNGLSHVIRTYRPEEAAVEETFVNRDAQGTLKLGQARGIALVVPALSQIPVYEYAANLIKKTVCGSGHADKEQILGMVKLLMPNAELNSYDAADALAIAITHAQHLNAKRLTDRVVRTLRLS